MKYRILVTGAAGFIGSKIANKLIENGNEVWTIDNLSTGFEENLHNNIKFINGNTHETNTIDLLRNTKFHAIFHYAGQSSGEISFEDPLYDLKTNTISTLRLLDYANSNRVKHFIYASSMSVYGENSNSPIKENTLLNPTSFYGVGKLASENYIHLFRNRISTTSLRLFNVYGPGQNLSNMKQGMVSIFLSQALNSNKIIVKGDLNRYRDFIHIDDVVDINLKLISKHEKESLILNVGSGAKTTVKELVNKILLYFPNKKIVNTKGTKGDVFGIYANIYKAKKLLNWYPKIGLDKGLNEMVEYEKK